MFGPTRAFTLLEPPEKNAHRATLGWATCKTSLHSTIFMIFTVGSQCGGAHENQLTAFHSPTTTRRASGPRTSTHRRQLARRHSKGNVWARTFAGTAVLFVCQSVLWQVLEWNLIMARRTLTKSQMKLIIIDGVNSRKCRFRNCH